MSECLVEKCQVNLTLHWSQEIPSQSLMIFDIFFWTCDALIFIFGIALNISVIHYEWYGGDPQKRSLSNRMMSSFAITQCTAGLILHTFAGMMRFAFIANMLPNEQFSYTVPLFKVHKLVYDQSMAF